MSSHARILIALVAGTLAAMLARQMGPGAVEAIATLEPVGTIFIRLVTMVIVPLVVASLFLSIVTAGAARTLGVIGGRALVFMIVSTAIAASVGVGVAAAVHVDRAAGFLADTAVATVASPTVSIWPQMLVDLVPSNPVAAAAQGELLPLMVAVCIFGAAAATLPAARRASLVSLSEAVNDVSSTVLRWVMAIAPLAVFVLMAVVTARLGLDTLRPLLTFTTTVIAALLAHVVLVLLPTAAFVAHVSVPRFLATISDAVLLAFSTASSAAALPVSMASAARAGIPAEVSSVVLPAGSNLNKNGAAVYKAVTAVFLAGAAGAALNAGLYVKIALAAALAAFAGAGVPGSSLVTTMIVLNAVGLGPRAAAGMAVLVGIDRPIDMCRSAVNTLGNLVCAAVVARAAKPSLGRPS
jgi:proton glutamate symport protein